MRNEQDHSYFDPKVTEELGHYVYALIDPDTKRPFYVGKGGGREGFGNRRVVYHFEEARRDSTNERKKILKIRKIWDEGHDVCWRIMRSGLKSEEEALAVESSLIDLLKYMEFELTNEQSGHYTRKSGILSPTDLRSRHAPLITDVAVPQEILGRDIFMFNISKGVAERRNRFRNDEAGLYEQATCQYWKVVERWRQLDNAIAIGCVNGVSRAVVGIDQWAPKEDRWEIKPDGTGDQKADYETLNLVNYLPVIERFKGYWGYGNYLIFRLETPTHIKVLRGSRSKSFDL